MVILQFQFTNITDEEAKLIPEFCNFLKIKIISELNTKVNRKKVQLRLKYIQEKATWISWQKGKKYELSIKDIFDTISQSMIYKAYKNNIYKIEIDSNMLIPYTYTSIDRLVRFLNFGDNECYATGIFTNIEHKYNHNQLYVLWAYYVLSNLHTNTNAKIITFTRV